MATVQSRSKKRNRNQQSLGDTLLFEENPVREFTTFIRENWKVILSEMVAAGVAAYIAHRTKDSEMTDIRN